jgi:signal transduction histidine kinase/ActR/RegA family two-component response regulator
LRPIRVHLLLLVLGAMLPGALLTGILAWRAFANDAPLGPLTIAVLTASVVLMVGCLAAAMAMARRLSAELAAATAAAEALAEGGQIAPPNAQVAEIQQLQHSLASAASLLEGRARTLEKEIKRADTARREAEQANEIKDQFLAVLGHELRNPLSPALTALELMKARDPGAFKREREVLERQVAHMARLVSDLLDVSSLALGKVQLHRGRFEIREAVDRAVDMARPLISQKQHTLNILVPTSGLQVDGDIDRIVQVLSNLLTNAAKYTPARGQVVLTARSSADRVVITCEDDGPGIAADLVPKLFDPFAQGPRALDRREGGGLGLGLALARNLTEAHGGTIHVQGRAGKAGSCFVVTLPLIPADVDGDHASPAEAAGRAEAKRVLVVDDNMDACEMLRAALEHAGHLVAIAGTGPDAIAIATDFVPDVAVLDLGLPGMSGYELASHLRRSRPPIRLIAVTGYGRAGDVEAAAAAGFDAHYAKPVAITALLAHIEADVGQDFSSASLEPT